MKTWKNDWNKNGNYKSGIWDDEPDKAQWEHNGFDCLIVRGPLGALCGYVGVPEGHELFGRNYDDLINIDVHGGLTFSGLCNPSDDDAHGICHVNGLADKVWWLGFDCAHLHDETPAMKLLSGEDVIYRNFDYVKKEVERLAEQL